MKFTNFTYQGQYSYEGFVALSLLMLHNVLSDSVREVTSPIYFVLGLVTEDLTNIFPNTFELLTLPTDGIVSESHPDTSVIIELHELRVLYSVFRRLFAIGHSHCHAPFQPIGMNTNIHLHTHALDLHTKF